MFWFGVIYVVMTMVTRGSDRRGVGELWILLTLCLSFGWVDGIEKYKLVNSMESSEIFSLCVLIVGAGEG